MTECLISVIVPVYNEKPNIEPTALALLDALGGYASDMEILFVDDNSPDGTADEVNRIAAQHPQVRLVQHGKKEGMGAAHRAGYEAANSKYVLCIDADLSQSPEDLVKMTELLDKGYDLVIGSRYMEGGQQVGKSAFRDIGSRGMNFICRHILGIPLTDCTHTFRAFRKSAFDSVASKIDQKGHPNFQVQFSFWVVKNRLKVTEIPIIFTERGEGRGQSKLSVKKEVPPFLKLVARLTIHRFSA